VIVEITPPKFNEEGANLHFAFAFSGFARQGRPGLIRNSVSDIAKGFLLRWSSTDLSRIAGIKRQDSISGTGKV